MPSVKRPFRYWYSIGFKMVSLLMLIILLLFVPYSFISISRQNAAFTAHLDTIETVWLETMQKQHLSLTKNLADSFQNAIIGMDFTFLKNTIEAIMDNNSDIMYGFIFHQSGVALVNNVRTGSGLSVSEKELLGKYRFERDNHIDEKQDGDLLIMEIYTPVIVGDDIWGSVVIGFSMTEVQNRLEEIRNQLMEQKQRASVGAFVTTALFIFIGFLASLLVGRWLGKPIEELTRGARIIGHGNLEWEFSTNRRDEIGILAKSFDQMKGDLKKLLDEQAEKKRIEVELNNARTIQKFTIPYGSPKINGIEFSGIVKTSSEIGGDFYDYFDIDDTRVLMVIGDVSGHGVSAGLVVAAIKSVMMVEAKRFLSVKTMMETLNTIICKFAHHELLTTCFLALYDSTSHQLRYSNAGHNYPYCYRTADKTLVELEESDFPLGLSRATSYQEHSVDLDVSDASDILILYTDGLVEGRNKDDETYNYPRFEESILSTVSLGPSEMRDKIINDAMAFYASQPIDDDISLLIAKPIVE